jgi:Mrp family chromosome partitioning ATPase
VGTISAGEPTLAGAAWRYRLLVVAVVVAVVGVGVIYAEVRPPAYSATATMVLQDPHNASVFAGSTGEDPARYVSDQIAVLQSPQLAAAAAAVAAAKTPPLVISAAEYSAHTVVSGTASNGNLVQVTFTARDAATALAGVDAIKTAYENTVRDVVNSELSSLLAKIDGEVASINAQLARATAQQQAALLARRDTLDAKRDQMVVDASSGSDGVTLYLAPQTTTHSSRLVTALPILSVAAVLGLVGGVLAAYVLAFRRRVFLSRTEPEAVLNAPMVGEIPRFASPLPTVDAAESAAATAFRGVALFIQTRHTEGQIQRLAVVSDARQKGRSTVAANLAVALADSGLSILLVDADTVSGGASRLLHTRFESVPIHDPVSIGAAGLALEDLVMPAQFRGRLALLRQDQTQPRSRQTEHEKLLAELGSDFNVVLVDAPPLNDVGPSLPLVRYAKGALAVVTDNTPVASFQEVARLLNIIDLPVVGYVYTHAARSGRTVFGSRRKAAMGERFDIEYRPIQVSSGPRSELSA